MFFSKQTVENKISKNDLSRYQLDKNSFEKSSRFEYIGLYEQSSWSILRTQALKETHIMIKTIHSFNKESESRSLAGVRIQLVSMTLVEIKILAQNISFVLLDIALLLICGT